MEIITVVLLTVLIVLNVVVIFSVKNGGKTSIDEKSKRELKQDFRDNVEIISSALEKSNDTSNRYLGYSLNQMNEKIKENNASTNQRLESLEKKQSEGLENIRQSLERNVKSMQDSNERKLAEIKQTVDEKLAKTVSDRFSESFKFLTDQLEKVTVAVGEMQNISKDVGNLSKVLSNVKTTGIFGEIELGTILNQMLSPEQYVKNVVANKSGKDPVEFAVKMPGTNEKDVLMPIDSKFPYTLYNDMISSYNANDFAEFEKKERELVSRIKGMAKDIHDKYICPPDTTNFAIMFLPIEGLYAEVVKLGLVEELQQKYNVTVAGPTTLSALLNSLQMGFQTLAIQKKSSEVWAVLSGVRSEFDKFNAILEQLQNRLNMANSDLDKLIGVRTRMIVNKLNRISSSGFEADKNVDCGSETLIDDI